jgi:hypothetical protein
MGRKSAREGTEDQNRGGGSAEQKKEEVAQFRKVTLRKYQMAQ